jgi:glucose/mannose transport system permease protein
VIRTTRIRLLESRSRWRGSDHGSLERPRSDRVVAILLILPSIIAIGIFVYGFIGWTGYVPLSRWRTLLPDYHFVGTDNYERLSNDFRFQADIRNTIVFTALFLLSATVLGFLAAALLDQKIKGEAFFRGEFLFPMAISFIVTGIVWQWLFHPSSGLNLLSRKAGYDGPVPAWSTDANVLFGLDLGKIEAGIRLRSCRSSWRRRGTSPASRWSAMPTRRRLRSSRPALKKRCARRTT